MHCNNFTVCHTCDSNISEFCLWNYLLSVDVTPLSKLARCLWSACLFFTGGGVSVGSSKGRAKRSSQGRAHDVGQSMGGIIDSSFNNSVFKWRDSLHIHACERFILKDTPEILRLHLMLIWCQYDWQQVISLSILAENRAKIGELECCVAADVLPMSVSGALCGCSNMFWWALTWRRRRRHDADAGCVSWAWRFFSSYYLNRLWLGAWGGQSDYLKRTYYTHFRVFDFNTGLQ